MTVIVGGHSTLGNIRVDRVLQTYKNGVYIAKISVWDSDTNQYIAKTNILKAQIIRQGVIHILIVYLNKFIALLEKIFLKDKTLSISHITPKEKWNWLYV